MFAKEDENGIRIRYCQCAIVICLFLSGCSKREIDPLNAMKEDVAKLTIGSKMPANICFDRAGNALYSWRFSHDWSALHVGSNANFQDPWTAESNEEWRKHVNPYYCFRDTTDTNVFAITGKDTAFAGSKKRAELPEDLVLIVEVANSGCHWMEPGDFYVDTMPREIGRLPKKGMPMISSSSKNGFKVGFVDGEVWILQYDIPFATLEKFLRISSAEKYDRQEELLPWIVERR